MTSLVAGDWSDKCQWASGPIVVALRSAVEQGADVNEPGSDGKTPLMFASSFSADPDVVSFLLSKGARHADTDSKGKTALMHLAQHNMSKVAASYATSLLGAGADPREKDLSGATAISEAKKRKNGVVLAVLEQWTPPPPSAEVLNAVRTCPWYGAWKQLCFTSVDKGFDAGASTVEILGLVAPEDEVDAHHELSALYLDLDLAYRGGKMAGGSLRQCSLVRLAHEKVVGRLSKVAEEQSVVIVFCGATKRDATTRRVLKYSEKARGRIAIAWATKESAYPVTASSGDGAQAADGAIDGAIHGAIDGARAVDGAALDATAADLAAIDVSDDGPHASNPATSLARPVSHRFEVRLTALPQLSAAADSPAAREASARAAEGLAQWLVTHWTPAQSCKQPSVRFELHEPSRVLVSTAAATNATAFEAEWHKAIEGVLKKVEVEDLGEMDAQRLLASIPETDADGRGLHDLRLLERELSVKVVFCAPPCTHVLLVGAKAKLSKKCFVLRNLLSHYHWRLSGRDVAFEAMTATR